MVYFILLSPLKAGKQVGIKINHLSARAELPQLAANVRCQSKERFQRTSRQRTQKRVLVLSINPTPYCCQSNCSGSPSIMRETETQGRQTQSGSPSSVGPRSALWEPGRARWVWIPSKTLVLDRQIERCAGAWETAEVTGGPVHLSLQEQLAIILMKQFISG